MDLKTMNMTPTWEWPEDSNTKLVEALRNDQLDESDRVLAAQLAGDFVVINEELANTLLSIVGNGQESERLRGRAAISLGPALQYADEEGFDGLGDAEISEDGFNKILESLHSLYVDADTPKEVRRRILEVAVRTRPDQQREEVRRRYSSDDDDWKLTAVFCMRWVSGFEDQIMESLKSDNPEIQCEAVWAAGEFELDGAWPHVVALVNDKSTEKHLLIAAISAVGSIRPEDAEEVLSDLAEHEDDDIVEAVEDAMVMAGAPLPDDFDDDDDLPDLLSDVGDRIESNGRLS